MVKKQTPSTPTPAVEPKAEKAVKIVLPEIGDIVLYRATATLFWPLLVTSVGARSFSGQAFQDGTEVQHITGTTFGDDAGQCVAK